MFRKSLRERCFEKVSDRKFRKSLREGGFEKVSGEKTAEMFRKCFENVSKEFRAELRRGFERVSVGVSEGFRSGFRKRFRKGSPPNRYRNGLTEIGSAAVAVSGVSGFGFRVRAFRVSGVGVPVFGFGCRVFGVGWRAAGFGLRESGFGIRDSDFDFRVWDFGIRKGENPTITSQTNISGHQNFKGERWKLRERKLSTFGQLGRQHSKFEAKTHIKRDFPQFREDLPRARLASWVANIANFKLKRI